MNFKLKTLSKELDSDKQLTSEWLESLQSEFTSIGQNLARTFKQLHTFDLMRLVDLKKTELDLGHLSQLNSGLISIDQLLNHVEHELSREESNPADENYEQKLARLKQLKQHLNSDSLKCDMERLNSLAQSLRRSSVYDERRLNYYNLTCRLDKLINEYEFNLSDLKKLTDKAQHLLEIIKQSHTLLSTLAVSTANRCTNNQNNSLNMTMTNSALNFNELFELQNNTSINEIIDVLRFKILDRLSENEPVKSEILDVYTKFLNSAQCTGKNCNLSLIKTVIDKIFHEWNVIGESCVQKIKALEKLKTKLNSLDSKLNKLREYVVRLEGYMNPEQFDADLDLSDYTSILDKKCKLESVYSELLKAEADTENLLSMCLSANKYYLNGNRQNESLIIGLKERWLNMKLFVREKLSKLNNVWLLISDLNDQMETFCQMLEKTEQFYACNVSAGEAYSNVGLMTVISQLYMTMNQDYKLIKYLNESYVNLVKFISNFNTDICLNTIREKLMSINSRWNCLHNQLAVKIKLVIRVYFSPTFN